MNICNKRKPRTSRQRICQGCGIKFTKKQSGRNAGKYHSRECAWASKAKRGEQKRREAKESTAIADAALRWMLGWKACSECGCRSWSNGNATLCSTPCRSRNHMLRTAKATNPCKYCEKIIGRVDGGKLRRVCDECSIQQNAIVRRRAKALRRARIKNNGPHDSINPYDVFERDRYRCYLCGQQTNPEAAVPEDDAPTIDHVIALANKGTHTMSNVMCACFKCNWMKGDD